MRISVVTVTYQSAACIAACIAAARAHLPDAEIVVVDNGSTDDSVAIAQANGATVIQKERNVGFGRACNAGIRAATGTHVLFVNPDVTIDGADRPELERLLGARPFGLVAGRLLDGSGAARAERNLHDGHWVTDYLEHTLWLLRPRGWRVRPIQLPGARGNEWASAALLLAARDELLDRGGFDERFFLYYEDRDLCARYQEAGLPVCTTDAIGGVHIGSSSVSGDALRIEPLGWAFLSWLEYVHIHEGEQTARRAASTSWRTLRTLRRVFRAGDRVGGGRIARKAHQLDELVTFLERQATAGSNGSAPAARRLLREVGA